jgi:hypothetical protein
MPERRAAGATRRVPDGPRLKFLTPAPTFGLIESRTKLLDPAAARAREEELGVVVATPKRDDVSAPPELTCRICGYRQTGGPFVAGVLGRDHGTSTARSVTRPIYDVARGPRL